MNPFEIRVADLRRSRAVARDIEFDVAVDWQLELSRLDPNPDGSPNLNLVLTLSPASGGLLVHGIATCTVQHACRRCLNEWAELVNVPISAVFTDVAVEDEDVFQLGDTIDIEAPVRDDVLTAMPLVPTCPDDCSPQLVGRQLVDAQENDLNTPAAAEDHSADGTPEDLEVEGSPFSVLRDLLDRGD